MSIQPIYFTSNNQNNKIDNKKKPFLTPSNTGFAAMGAMALTTARTLPGLKKGKHPLKSHHKILGYISAALVLLHFGTAVHSAVNRKKSEKLYA